MAFWVSKLESLAAASKTTWAGQVEMWNVSCSKWQTKQPITIWQFSSIKKNISIFLKGPIQTTLADHSAGIWEVNVSLCVCGHRVPCCTCCIWIWADPWSERADDKRECVNDDHSCRHTRHWSQACDGLHPRRVLHGGDGQHDRWKRPGQLRECHCYHSQLPCWRPR